MEDTAGNELHSGDCGFSTKKQSSQRNGALPQLQTSRSILSAVRYAIPPDQDDRRLLVKWPLGYALLTLVSTAAAQVIDDSPHDIMRNL